MAVLLGCVGLVAAAAPRPNILFILTDDLGYGDLGVYFQNSRAAAANRNQPWFATPKLDTLGSEGLQLTRHYCPAPVCAPSRASLLLGVHQGHANVRDNQFDKALENNHTLATVLKGAGYTTAIIGKYGLQGTGSPAEAHPLYRGFDYFFGLLAHLDGHLHYAKEDGGHVYDNFAEITTNLDKCYSTDLFTARTKRWLQDHAATNAAQPFFLYLAFDAPHARLEIPTQAYPAGSGTTGGLQWVGTPGAMINTASGTTNSWLHPDYASATWDDDNNRGTAEVAWPTYAKNHATMVRRLDDAVADIVQTLKDLNLDTNTLVVFTSDNGTHNEAGTGGTVTYLPTFFDSFARFDGIKRDCWEGGIRMPALVRWPAGIAPGRTNATPSAFWDWMPTFAELAGVPAPARTDGVSLVPTLTGTGTQRASNVYIEYSTPSSTPNYTDFDAAHRSRVRNQMQVVLLEGYKGVRYNITNHTQNFEIYDPAVDTHELTNRAASLTALQQRMKDRVLQVRRPDAGAVRPYDAELVPSVTTTSLVVGLRYRAFEGDFPWLPDFANATNVAAGQCTNLDLTVRTRNDRIGLLYEGYLQVPVSGTYTFYLTPDSRALMRLHDATVLDADFGHTNGAEVSASISLSAGYHPFRLGYARATGGTPSVSLEWSGPAFVRQPVPASALVTSGTGTPLAVLANPDRATTVRAVPVMVDVLANDLGGGGPLIIAGVSSP
jgi:arylsulfatase A-like enzyme